MRQDPLQVLQATSRQVPAVARPSADVAVVLFEPPRLFYDRERALWTPAPQQLLPLARLAPAGIHVAAPELVWQAAQGGVHEVARQWLA